MQLSYFICSHFRIDPQQCSVLPCHSLLFMCSGFFSLSWKCWKIKFFISQFSWKPNKPKLLDLFTCFGQFVFSGCFGCTNWYLVCVPSVDSFVYFFPYRHLIFLPFLWSSLLMFFRLFMFSCRHYHALLFSCFKGFLYLPSYTLPFFTVKSHW